MFWLYMAVINAQTAMENAPRRSARFADAKARDVVIGIAAGVVVSLVVAVALGVWINRVYP